MNLSIALDLPVSPIDGSNRVCTLCIYKMRALRLAFGLLARNCIGASAGANTLQGVRRRDEHHSSQRTDNKCYTFILRLPLVHTVSFVHSYCHQGGTQWRLQHSSSFKKPNL